MLRIDKQHSRWNTLVATVNEGLTRPSKNMCTPKTVQVVCSIMRQLLGTDNKMNV